MEGKASLSLALFLSVLFSVEEDLQRSNIGGVYRSGLGLGLCFPFIFLFLINICYCNIVRCLCNAHVHKRNAPTVIFH